jgi:hypothetical protein
MSRGRQGDRDATRPPGRRGGRITEGLANRLFRAIENDDEEAFRRLLAETYADDSWTDWALWFLLEAIERGQVGIVGTLLEAGCPAHDIDGDGETPLMVAAWLGRLEVARMLLDAGADPDVLVEDHRRNINPEVIGLCALQFALRQGHQALVDLLLPVTRPEVRALAYEGVERRRRADARTEVGRRADTRTEAESGPKLSLATVKLFIAAQTPDVEKLRAAIAEGADVNALLRPDASNRLLGSSPLSFAAARGRPDLVDLLLQAGADPGLTDHTGRTAADFAALNGHHEIARSLGGPSLEDGQGRA